MKWTDDELDLALRGLGAQDPPPAALAAVRAGVLDRIRRPRWWMWTWAPVAAAVVLAVLLWPRPAEIAPPPLLAAAPTVPAAAWVKTEKPKPQAVRRERPLLEATDIPGLVRVATRDPNIILYWSFDNGEGDEE
jgi:hypothetical protein